MSVNTFSPEKMPASGQEHLQRAFALPDVAAAEKLYEEWATSYDHDIMSQDYASPRRTVEAALVHLADPPSETTTSSSSSPARRLRILDAGCGTGLVGLCLAASAALPSPPQGSHNLLKDFTLDGLDLAPAMLELARKKNIYRQLDVADLTKPLACETGSYDLVTCVGTLTKGHVGPGVLAEFVRVVAEGGIVAATVHGEVWESMGYADEVARLANQGTVHVLGTDEFGITEGASDGGRMVLLRKK